MARLLGLHPLQLSSVITSLISNPWTPLCPCGTIKVPIFALPAPTPHRRILSTSVIEKESTKFLEGSRTR